MRLLESALLAVALLATGCATHRSQWIHDMRGGSVDVSLGDYEAARREFNSALNTADAMLPYYTRRWAFQFNSLDALAALAALEGRWGDAETHLTRLRAIAEDRLAEPYSARIDLSFRQALVHLHRVEEATQFQELVLSKAGTLQAASEAAFAQELERAGYHALAVAAFDSGEAQAGLDEGVSGMVVVERLRSYGDALHAVGRATDAQSARAKADAIRDGSDYMYRVLFGGEFQAIAAYWPAGRMPLSVRIERPNEDQTRSPDDAMAMAREAVLAWAGAVASGIPSFEFLEGSDAEVEPEIIIRWDHDESGHYWAGRCTSDARWEEDPLQRSDVVINSRVSGRYRPEAQIRHILVHEVGHALGLLGHSTLKEDVMYPALVRDSLQQPSARDLRTLRRLYGEPLGGYGPRMSAREAEAPPE